MLSALASRTGTRSHATQRCAGATARSRQDPHLDLAHGGSADFRGTDQGLYNYLSTPGLSVNARFEEALYTLHDGLLLVNGTFMTEKSTSPPSSLATPCASGPMSAITHLSSISRIGAGEPSRQAVAAARSRSGQIGTEPAAG